MAGPFRDMSDPNRPHQERWRSGADAQPRRDRHPRQQPHDHAGQEQPADCRSDPAVDRCAREQAKRGEQVSKGSADANIAGKVVVITGASSGLGEATARYLADRGAIVVLGARRAERLQALADDIARNDGKASAVVTDVTDPAQVHALVDAAVERHGRVDVILNNAGVMPHSPLERRKIDDWNRTIDINIKGVLYGIAAALPHMQRQRAGHIINVSSVAGHKVGKNMDQHTVGLPEQHRRPRWRASRWPDRPALLRSQKPHMSASSVPAHLRVSDRIVDLLDHPAFAGFSRFLLPWDDRRYDPKMPLGDIGSLLPYHTHVDPAVVVSSLNLFNDTATTGKRIFYDLSTDTGLFFF